MDSQSELSDRKRCREENPEALPSPEQNTNTKKKKKKKKNKVAHNPQELNAEHPQLLPEPSNGKGAEPKEASVEELPQVCPNHEPNEATTPQKRKWERKKKNVLNRQGEELNAENPPQLCPPLDPAIAIPIESEQKNINEKGPEPSEANAVHPQPQVCPKHELEPPVDTAIPIAPQNKKGVESNEITASKLELAPPVPVDLGKEKGEGVGPNEVTAQNPELLSLPDPTPPEDTPQKKKKWEKKKKNVLNCQGAEPNAEHPLLCNPVDPAIPIGLDPKIMKEKGAEVEPNEANAEQPQVCPKHESAIPVVSEKKEGPESNETGPKHEPANKKGAGPNEATAEHPELLPVPDPTPSKDTPQKRKWERKKKNVLKPQGEELKEPNNAEHPQLCSSLDPEPKNRKENEAEPNEANAEHPQICPKPEPAPPLDIASPIDPEKKKEAEPTEANAEHPQVCPKPESAPPVGSAIPINPEKRKEAEHSQPQPQPCSKPDPAPPGDPTTPIDQSRTKKRNRRHRKRIMCSEEKVENQRNPLQSSLNQTQPDPAIPICPKPASPIDQAIQIDQTIPVDPGTAIDPTLSICPKPVPVIGQTIPVSPAIPIDTEQKTIKKKRKKKRKSTLNGAEPIEHNTKSPETLIQTSMCPIAAAPIGPAIPTDPEQKTTKKKRKKKRKKALKSEGEEPNKHNGKPPETPVQRSMCHIAAPPIDQTIPIDLATLIDPATPIDPEQKMTKKKRKKKRNSGLKSEGTEPDEPNAEPTVETPVQRTKGLTVTKVPFKWPGESSMSKRNAKPPAKTRAQRTKGLAVTKVPFKRHGESFMRCQACRQPGHKFQQCPRLKCLSMDEEICFFCGEIGHSLGKCSVSLAGGGRFAKCLFCYAQGHFSNNCPRNGHGIDPKVVAANGPINKTVETEGRSITEVTNM